MIQWQKKYEIGVEKVDLEHRTFLALINDYNEQMLKNPDLRLLGHRVNEIHKYAEFHFLSEENLMEETGYPELEEHRGLHQTLIHRLVKEGELLARGTLSPSTLGAFVLEWFVGHTTHEDLRIADYLKSST